MKYIPPEHVIQFSPDYSMISHSKPKRRKTKRDDFSVWFGDIGSTYVRKKIYHKKKKKKVSPTNIKSGLSGPARGEGLGGGWMEQTPSRTFLKIIII